MLEGLLTGIISQLPQSPPSPTARAEPPPLRKKTAHLPAVPPIHAWAIFSPACPAFDGHFPGAPILPGFLHIQLALEILHLAGLRAELLELHAAKFLRPVPPATRLNVQILPLSQPDWFDVAISDSTDLVSKFQLRITPATARPGKGRPPLTYP